MATDRHIHDQALFFAGSISMFSGIFLTNIFRENAVFVLIFLCILAIQFLFFSRLFLPYILVSVLFFCLGGYMSLERLREIDAATESFERETVFFTRDVPIKGTIAEKLSENDTSARYILRNISLGTRSFPSELGIIATFPDSRNKNIDSIIAFTGMLRLPVNNENFDYRTYLLLDNVYATVSVAFPDKVWMEETSRFTVFISRVRERILATIEGLYPWESAKLLEGILIGERASLSSRTKKDFNSSWLTHIVAVSGFNITIILLFLSFLFRSFPISVRMFLALLCVGFFTLLVGSQISVLRASIFGLISYIVLLSGKKVRAFPLLLAVALGFVVLDPLILNYDVSFHLSFLAVFGLLFFGDFFHRVFFFVPKWFAIRESLSMCLAATVFTLPVVMVNFQQVSLISPIANVVIVPFIPFVMLGGFISAVWAIFSPHIGVLSGFPTWLWLQYILRGVAWFGSLPYAAVPIDFGIYRHVFVVGYFLAAGFLAVYFRQEEE